MRPRKVCGDLGKDADLAIQMAQSQRGEEEDGSVVG